MSSPVALVLGGRGLLGLSLMQQLAGNGWETQSLDLEDCDLTPSELQPRIEALAPSLILNAANAMRGYIFQEQPQELLAVNRGLPAFLGGLVKGTSTRLVHFSTALVFNGKKGSPYTEEDAPTPLTEYAQSRRSGELALLEIGGSKSCIIRTGWLFGPGGYDFIDATLEQAKTHETLDIVHDRIGSPCYVPDIAAATLNLLKHDVSGLYHIVNAGQATWCELASEAVRLAGVPCTVRAVPSPENDRQPAYDVLSSARYSSLTGCSMRPWAQALREYIYTKYLPR